MKSASQRVKAVSVRVLCVSQPGRDNSNVCEDNWERRDREAPPKLLSKPRTKIEVHSVAPPLQAQNGSNMLFFSSQVIQLCAFLPEHYEVVVSSIGKSNSKKESEIEGDRVEKSNFENVFDVTPAVGKGFIENVGDVLGHAEMDTEKSDMYTRLKAQPRKRVRSVLLKTPWTRLDRKNHRRIV
ncbi:hypothetical protein LR48_Vigan02g093500 [Vigna angularis]|uniref:Uncharacterized protein n=1 Tax=Phaseolus angularis TaxID=3914 RepID=A0A0L9TW57_PHAAN|nr:hypothetical protein LR48_Vigan02g093500 [Vigna angularis]